ncbi:MAG: prolipoprotein diacylglyceryl transferase [Candidatus Saccharimonas sp.]|nr:prolipoprotein diacylglyceryl transferase [Planctomycetaceae bacterium]
MRQVLFQIPLDRPWSIGPFGQVPGFGFGIVLLAWVLFGAWMMFERRKESERKFDADDIWSLARWLIGAAVIAFGAPMLGAYLRANGSPHFRDGLPMFGYGFMLTLGLASALWLAMWRAEREGVPTDLIWDLAFCLFLGGIAGGRLFYLVQKRDEVFANVNDQWSLLNAVFNLSQGGLVLYGALLAGAATFFTFCHFRRVSPLGLVDIITPSIFVGIGFGRIGCFLNGCCYGDECSLPWAVQFPRGSATFEALVFKKLIPSDASWTPPLHPTQLYSALDGFLIAALTFWYFRHRRRNGECFAVALMIYPVTRFVIEILRNDEGGQLGTSLTISQWVSIGLLLVNLGYMVWLSQRPAVRDPIKVPELGTAAPPRKPDRLVRSSA